MVNLGGWYLAKKGEVCMVVTAVTAIQVNTAKLSSGECTHTHLVVGLCKREHGHELSRKEGKQVSHEPMLSCGWLQQRVGVSSDVS